MLNILVGEVLNILNGFKMLIGQSMNNGFLLRLLHKDMQRYLLKRRGKKWRDWANQLGDIEI